MSSLSMRDTIKGSISIGKGEQGPVGPVGPVGPQGPIGDNNVCIGLSPTLEAEIWFDANDDDYSDVIVTQSEIKDFKENVSNSVSEFKSFKENITAENLAFKNKIDDSINSYKTDVDSSITSFKNNINSSITSFKNEVNNSNETFKNEIKENQDTFIKSVNKDIFEDSKIDFFGKEHDKLEHRLNADFDNVHQRINESELLPYEGTNIKADNTYYGLQKDTVIKGRTLQNVCKDIGNFYRFTGTLESGIITLNQKTESTVFVWEADNFILKKDTVYTTVLQIIENTVESASSNNGSVFNLSNSGFGAGSFTIQHEEGGWYNIQPKQTGIFRKKFNYVTEGAGLNGVVIGTGGYLIGKEENPSGYIKLRIMFLEGDHTQTPLEELPFIEGIESAGDKSKNLFDGQLEEGSFTSTGELDKSPVYIRTVNFIKAKPNTQYALSYKNDDVRMAVCEYDINKNFIKVLYDGNPKYFTTSETTQYLKFRVEKSSTNIQLEEGTQATPYEPYYDGYKISGKSCGKNLAKEISEENYIANGNGSVNFYDGYCTAIDKSGWSSCNIIGKDAIKVKPNTIYYGGIECEEDLSQARLTYKCFDINNNIIKTSRTVTLSNDAVNFYASTYNSTYEAFLPLTNHYKYVKFSSEVHSVKLIFRPISSSGIITNTFKNIIFAETDKEPTYEPYQESTYSYILNEPLRSLPNGVCDTIDLETGVLTRRVGKVVFDGNEGWHVYNTDNASYNEAIVTLSFKCDSFHTNNSITNNCPQSDTHRIVCVGGKQVYYRVPKTVGSDLESFKQWLQDNPTTVYYELAEPTIEQLTPQQLKSFDTTTHIISDNKLMPIVSTKIPSNVQAIISTLKLENSDLKNNVEVLTVENEELKSVNNVQDEMIDINMLATDEVYSLIEPLLLDMLSERGVSKLVDMYVAMVQRGLKTLDEVPTRYSEQVREILEALEK